MKIQKLKAAYGWRWIKQGYQLIMLNPLMAVALALICAFAMFAALSITEVGPFIAVLLMPVLMAGYMRVCRALEEEEDVELAHLFTGFQKHTLRLATLGGFIILGMIVIVTVMTYIGGDELITLLEKYKSANDQQVLADAMSAAKPGVAFSLMAGFALSFVLTLALQYAPMLVLFNDMPPLAALRAGIAGSMRNIVPYTVYSIIMQAIAVVLSILPFGIGLTVLIPLIFTSLYVSYRNIFPFEGEITGS